MIREMMFNIVKDRTVKLPRVIEDNDEYKLFISQLDELAGNSTIEVPIGQNVIINLNKAPIYIQIHSYGGNFDVGRSIILHLLEIETMGIPIVTVNNCEADSASFWIHIFGTPGYRLSTSNSISLSHGVKACFAGSLDSIDKSREITSKCIKELRTKYIERMKVCKFTRKQTNNMVKIIETQEDTYLCADVQFENRFTDFIIDSNNVYSSLWEIIDSAAKIQLMDELNGQVFTQKFGVNSFIKVPK